MKRWKVALIAIFTAIFAIILAAVIAFVSIWHNEIATGSSFTMLRDRNDEHKDGAVYKMTVHGGFYFDEFLKTGGASKDSELIGFITNHITRGLIDMGITETDIGCSSFTAVTPSGDRIFARNYDFDLTNTCLTYSKPGGGRHASFSSVDLNYIGLSPRKNVEGLMNKITALAAPFVPLDGINDAGVSCGIYMSYQGESTVATNQNDPEKDNITSTTMLRLVLDYADDVDEAVELIKKYNLHDSANTSFHYMVADATGRSAILEWVAPGSTDKTDNDGTKRELVVTYNDDDAHIGAREGASDFQWITNFIIQPGYYEDDSQKPGVDRYDIVYDRLSATNGVVANEWAAMDILQAVGQRNIHNGVTVHSAVYNLTKKTVLWVSNENYDDPTAIYAFDLNTGKYIAVPAR